MATIASVFDCTRKRTMATDSQTLKTCIYQVLKELWNKKKVEKKQFSRQVAAILINGGKLKI